MYDNILMSRDSYAIRNRSGKFMQPRVLPAAPEQQAQTIRLFLDLTIRGPVERIQIGLADSKLRD